MRSVFHNVQEANNPLFIQKSPFEDAFIEVFKETFFQKRHTKNISKP